MRLRPQNPKNPKDPKKRMTQIKNSPGALINISISGYEFVNVNSFTNAGGVGVYIAESFQHELDGSCKHPLMASRSSLLGTQTSKGTAQRLRFYNLKKQQIPAKYRWALSHMK